MADPAWVKVQQKTFTRWVNTYFVERMLKVDNLQTDFADGVFLINLLEIISSKQFQKYNKNPKIQMQKLENLTFALDFLAGEGIKLVSIDSNAIASGNLKLILGLIWTIILRYQIQVSEGASAKAELLEWVRSKIPEYNINNFVNDWTSGKAICALAEAVLPGQMRLPSDFKGDPIANARMGMTKAKDNMGIPEILDAEDMVHNPDELSNMTYISYFRDYEGLEKRRKDQDLVEKTPVAAKCLAYGPGLEPGNEAGNETHFTIEARNVHGRKVPIGGHSFPVKIQGPSGEVPSKTVDNGDGTYSVAYTPKEEGNHVIHVTHKGENIQKSPFNVYINPARADAIQSRVYGPGVEAGEAHVPSHFTIEARNKKGDRINKGGHPFTAKVTDPFGQPLVCDLVDKGDGTYDCSYLPADPGEHVVEVFLNRDKVAKSPYHVKVSENQSLASSFHSYADGPGLKPGNKSGDPAEFTIYAVLPSGKPKKSGGDAFDVTVEDQNGELMPVTIKDNGDGTYKVTYQPKDPGTYHVDVIERNPTNPVYYDHLKNSPIDVVIDPGTDANNSIAYGPGLEPGNLDTAEDLKFTIEARDNNGKPIKQGGDDFQVDIQGPDGPVQAKVKDNGDGTYAVSYKPNGPGPHDIAVTLDDVPIKGSTFHVDIKPGAWARNCFIDHFTFLVQTRDKRDVNLKEGGSNVAVDIKGPKGPVHSTLKDNKDGTYTTTYSIKEKGNYTVAVTVDGTNIKGSPFNQNVQ
jgi:filamin